MENRRDTDVYFLGTMVLYKKDGKHYVIDGQQRLAALTILFAVIRDSIKDQQFSSTLHTLIFQEENSLMGTPKAERVTPWPKLETYFKEYVYERNKTKTFLETGPRASIEKDDPIFHLYEAIQAYHGQLSQLDEEQLKTLAKYFLNNVYIVHIVTSERTSAIRLFNVLNNRGVPLSSADIIKSENLEAIPDAERENYALKWISLEEKLGRDELEKLLGFLRTVKAKYKAVVSLDAEYEKLYEEKLLVKGEQFIEYLEKATDIYDRKIVKAKIHSADSREQNRYSVLLKMMKEYIPFGDWIPPLLAFSEKFKSADSHIVSFLDNLERKTFVEWAAGFSETERLTSFSRVIELVDNGTEPKDIIDSMLTYRSRTSSSMRGRFIDYTDASSVRETLSRMLADDQFYSLKGGKMAKYVLLRSDMELWDLEAFPGYYGRITVEHVLPQSPEAGGYWSKRYNPDEMKIWTNRLGNLLLLSGRKNTSAGNLPFPEKKETYFRKKSTPFKLTQEALAYSDWDLQTLSKRHSDMMNRVSDLYAR